MAEHRSRPRNASPPPFMGSEGRAHDQVRPVGGNQLDASHSIDWGRGRTSVSRQLRQQASQAEIKLWQALRRKALNDLRFRRQFPLGPYFADFVCLPARLIVEVDGGQHGLASQSAHDARRTAWLEANGFRVVRFWADEVMTNVAAVLDGIEAAINESLPQGTARTRPLAPSRKGRGNAKDGKGRP